MEKMNFADEEPPGDCLVVEMDKLRNSKKIMKALETFDGSTGTPNCYIGGIGVGNYQDVLYSCKAGSLHKMLDANEIDHKMPPFIMAKPKWLREAMDED